MKLDSDTVNVWGIVWGMWDVVEHSGSTGRMSYMHVHLHSFKVHTDIYGVNIQSTYRGHIILCRVQTAEKADTREKHPRMLRIAAAYCSDGEKARDAESVIGRHERWN